MNRVDEREVPEFAPARVDVEPLQDGGVILRSPLKLEAYATSICTYLVDWAERAPERVFLGERLASGGWRRVTYGEALTSVRALAQALLTHEVTTDRPLMILSDNSIESGLLQLAAMFVGIPVSPVSPAYSLMSRDFGKLKSVFDFLITLTLGRSLTSSLALTKEGSFHSSLFFLLVFSRMNLSITKKSVKPI